MKYGNYTLGLTLAASLTASICGADTKLSMATSWGGGPPLEIWAQNFADSVSDLTRGELEIELFTAGTLGSALKVAETVKNGVAEVGHTFIGYEYGADKTTVLFAGRPGGLNAEEMIHWLNTAGGKELWREYRLETAGVVAFPCSYVPREAGMFSSKPVKSIEDFDGLKLRTAGAWAEIAGELGMATVVVPGAEVYQALERGVVDAVEWSTLSLNKSSGFHKVAPYIIMPGFHQSVVISECSFNVDTWNSLSETHQSAIENAAYIAAHRTYEITGNNDADAYQFFLDSGAEFINVDNDVLEKVEELVVAWEDRVSSEEGGWFSRVLEHQRAFKQRWKNAEVYR
ncbi:MAG: TRAP transporter substrate-binding protein DctP [Alphaproteobacteria bacterium]